MERVQIAAATAAVWRWPVLSYSRRPGGEREPPRFKWLRTVFWLIPSRRVPLVPDPKVGLGQLGSGPRC